jgi:hypothetical protein
MNGVSVSSYGTAAATVIDPRPVSLRHVFRKGERILQYAHRWECGQAVGVKWVDVPTCDEQTGEQL